MMSFYPRTRTLCLNSMEIYKEALSTGLSPVWAVNPWSNRLHRRSSKN